MTTEQNIVSYDMDPRMFDFHKKVVICIYVGMLIKPMHDEDARENVKFATEVK